MSFFKAVLLTCAVVFLKFCACEVLVQVNVNRPFNDVSEKFISFSVRPEDLYSALDGPRRKTMTQMATTLGDSYIKFIGDYFFAANAETKLRNPTKVIWKGFNRWTRAVNWTMVIPVPYTPGDWEPMHALKILNTSYMVGISDCIWQLGTDFGVSRAEDYVAELKTFNLMVESFKSYVDDWQIMGADISSGSTADETRQYIEISQDLNSALGWTESTALTSSNTGKNFINENDPALKVLLSSSLPVWLTLPYKAKSNQKSNIIVVDDVADAMRWAQMMGDAASTGFDAIFKHISLYELENPTNSFYVTALFKKVMGSRVFPSRPLHLFGNSNKLYTHCANSVSGGIAFMVVNTEETANQISLRSLSRFSSTEVWQYILTFKKGAVQLNNEKIHINSTFKPVIKVKHPDKPVQLNSPGMSVSFWVLPTVNLEHCQFTEIAAEEDQQDSNEFKASEKRYSSSDKLLRQLIQETSLSQGTFLKGMNRRRRYATFGDRSKRFILEDKNSNKFKMPSLIQPIDFGNKELHKRDNQYEARRLPVLQWLHSLMDLYPNRDRRLVKRDTHSSEDYFGSLFEKEKKTPLIKKILEIKKPDRKVKPIFNLEEFDEEKFFKKISEHSEPEYRRFPEGDIHLKHITNANGEEIFDYNEEKKEAKKKVSATKNKSKEMVSEMKPLRLLPTEFYEALPLHVFQPQTGKINIGSALNSLLFPEPFSKKITSTNKKFKSKFGKEKEKHKLIEKSDKKEKGVEKNGLDEHSIDSISEIEAVDTGKFHKSGQLAQDFLRAQKELSKSYLKDSIEVEKKEEKEKSIESTKEEDDIDVTEKISSAELRKRKTLEYLAHHFDKYFGTYEDEKKRKVTQNKDEDTKQKESDDDPWWDLSSLRKKRKTRALQIQVPEEAWLSNMITKDEDITPLGATMPEKFDQYKYAMVDVSTERVENIENVPIANRIMRTVKRKLNRFVDLVSRHVGEWYNTITKHIEIIPVDVTTATNNVN